MVPCAIFDLDGTIADTVADFAVAINRIRKRFGLAEQTEDQIRSFLGNGLSKLLERSFAGAESGWIPEAGARFHDEYRATGYACTTLYPGVSEGLAALKRAGWRIALASNKPEIHCRPILRAVGIESYFDAVYGGIPNRKLKPDPESILLIMKELDADPENTWILGDNWTDLESGRRAGIRKSFAAWGYGVPGMETFDFQADTFPEFTANLLQRVAGINAKT